MVATMEARGYGASSEIVSSSVPVSGSSGAWWP